MPQSFQTSQPMGKASTECSRCTPERARRFGWPDWRLPLPSDRIGSPGRIAPRSGSRDLARLVTSGGKPFRAVSIPYSNGIVMRVVLFDGFKPAEACTSGSCSVASVAAPVSRGVVTGSAFSNRCPAESLRRFTLQMLAIQERLRPIIASRRSTSATSLKE